MSPRHPQRPQLGLPAHLSSQEGLRLLHPELDDNTVREAPHPRLPSFLEQSPSRTCGLILGILLLTQLFPKHELALNKAFVSGDQGRCFEPSPKAEKNHQRIFLPSSKGRKSSNTHSSAIAGDLPYKDEFSPKDVKVRVGR